MNKFDAFQRTIPGDKIPLRDQTYYFWMVSREDWDNGRPKRIRMKYEDAKTLAILVGYVVEWCPDQTVDKDKQGMSGSQRSLIYGTRPKYDDVKESEKARS